MDVYDNPASPNFIATFELPGVRTADMKLSVKEGNLIIDGERRCPMIHCGAANEPPKVATDDGHGSSAMKIDVLPVKAAVKELRYGRFYRAVPLPPGVQQSDISAQLYEGMLTVSWPRVVDTGSATASAPETPMSVTATLVEA
ncbi:hypothetical protein BDZ89DRAFT_1011914 [Hymenopellis radicata]|nr:hypothetical protein BDZ89DRAFT_1011914 [Hymenopellis radicata]